MISLATMGMLDTSFLVPLQVYQTLLIDLVKTTAVAMFAPARLAWDESQQIFIYAYDTTSAMVA